VQEFQTVVQRALPEGLSNDHLIEAFVQQVRATEILASILLSGRFTDEERAAVLKRFPNSGFFRFSTMIGALCSKTAFDRWKAENHPEVRK
jgi:hypothetical protein